MRANKGVAKPHVPSTNCSLEAEAKRIGAQLTQTLTQKSPEAIALQALCNTMRFGNRPGMVDVQETQQGTGQSPVKEDTTLPGQIGVTFAKLVVSAAQFGKNEKITVTWSHSSPTTGDWVGIYLENDGDRNYKVWDWINLQSNSVTFTAPSECGVYNVRYFNNKSYICQGTSQSFTVGPVFSLNPISITSTEIKVHVNQKFGENCPNLWVAIYRHGEVNPKSYVTYEWAKHGQELTFPISKVGPWTLKAFPEKTYDHAAVQSVVVPGSDSLTLALEEGRNKAIVTYDISTVDPSLESVWIGIYRVEEEDPRNYRRYKYVTDRKGSFEVKAMQTAGVYEARIFANGTYDVLCKSSTQVTVVVPQ